MEKEITLLSSVKDDRIKALDFMGHYDIHGRQLIGIKYNKNCDTYVFLWSYKNNHSTNATFSVKHPKVYYTLNLDKTCHNAIGSFVWLKDGNSDMWYKRNLTDIYPHHSYPFQCTHNSYQFMCLTDPDNPTP